MCGYHRSQGASASRSQVMTAPSPSAENSDFACCEAPSPLVCRLLSVVAAAVPLGKGSCSTLIICRLVGTARNTPSHATTAIHGIRTIRRCAKSAGSADGFSMSSAGMAFTSPALVMAPAAEAHDCMALFSRML